MFFVDALTQGQFNVDSFLGPKVAFSQQPLHKVQPLRRISSDPCNCARETRRKSHGLLQLTMRCLVWFPFEPLDEFPPGVMMFSGKMGGTSWECGTGIYYNMLLCG